MKTVILAGGFGTRLSEETSTKPKPMVEIGGRPILWHILKNYSAYGFKEFVIALGYKADVIKKYFIDYAELSGNLTVHIKGNTSEIIHREKEEWTIYLEDTGLDTYTGGRIKNVAHFINNETFMATYGDGVSDVPLDKLLAFHKAHGKLATITSVRPPARFGSLTIQEDNLVTAFAEKPRTEGGWINGGFFVFEPEVINLIPNNKSSLEGDVLEELARQGQLVAYQHEGFWQCMDTLRDLKYLEGLWNEGQAPWKVWDHLSAKPHPLNLEPLLGVDQTQRRA